MFLDINPTEAEAPKCLDAGSYTVEVQDVTLEEQKPEKGTSNFLRFVLRATEYPDAAFIYETVMLPDTNVPDKTNARLLRLKRICEAIGYDASNGIEIEDLKGLQAQVILAVEHDDQYGDRNNVKRWLPAG